MCIFFLVKDLRTGRQWLLQSFIEINLKTERKRINLCLSHLGMLLENCFVYGCSQPDGKYKSAQCSVSASVCLIAPRKTCPQDDPIHTHTQTHTHWLHLCFTFQYVFKSLAVSRRCSNYWKHRHTHSSVLRFPNFSLTQMLNCPLLTDHRCEW